MPRFPLTLQHDSMQCGIACLQMVCNHYGRYYSLGYLEQICHATAEGVGVLFIDRRKPYKFSTRIKNLNCLLHRCLHIVSWGVGHRLHTNGISAAHLQVAYCNFVNFKTFVGKRQVDKVHFSVV